MGEADAAESTSGITLGHLALKRGLITPEQLREALSDQSRAGQDAQGRQPLDAILVSKGFITETQLLLLRSSPEALESGKDSEPVSFGKYRLRRELGRGAMAVVYEALDTELDRPVALKMILMSPNANREEAALDEERFIREARLSAQLKHPHIVGVYDAGAVQGRRYLAMELIQGRPMDDWRKQGSVTLRQRIALLRDVALAVHHAHEEGVIHRDLKPANILVDENNHPHVTDFGLAKRMGQNVKMSFTEGDLVVGTPAYMSPEQAQGLKTLDRRTDVYSMGVMLYEILTGRLPFVGDTALEVLVKTSKDPVIPPSKITSVKMNPIHFTSLEQVCLKALSKSSGERYVTAEAFAADLTRWLSGETFRVKPGGAARRIAGLALACMGVAAVAALLVAKPWRPSAGQDLKRADQLMKDGKLEEALAAYTHAAGLDKEDPRAAEGREEAIRRLREKSAQAAAAKPAKTARDLLASADLRTDAVSGKWTRVDRFVVAHEGRPARLQFPYHPPEEYDVHVVFERQSGNFCVNLILPKAGRTFALVMQRGGLFGFEKLRGKDYHENASFRRTEGRIESGRSYTAVVEVRNDGLRVTFEGQLVSEWKTDYSDLSMNPDWKLPDPSAVGVGAWDGTVVLHRFEILDVSGKGSATRPPSAEPKK